MKIYLIALFLVLASASIEEKFKLVDDSSAQSANLLLKQTQTSNLDEDSISRFFVIGDFGDLETYSDLEHVTNIMENLSSNQNFDFIATVGDNVYENGIESMKKLDDVNKIMKSFKKPHIKNTPMYLTLGNHDCYSDYENEIKYHDYDKQWNMESDYYKLKFPLKDDPNKYLVLLMANSCLLDCLTEFKDNKKDCEDMNTKMGGNRVKEHYEWMHDKLKKYSEDPEVAWLGVVMHHSVFIVPGMKEDLLPLLRKYKVDFALVGHNHRFDYSNIGYDEKIKFPGKDYGDIIDDWDSKKEILNTPTRYQEFKKSDRLHQFMVGGSGRKFAKICPYREQDGKVHFQSVEEHGMMTIEINSKQLTAKYYQRNDKIVYQVTIKA